MRAGRPRLAAVTTQISIAFAASLPLLIPYGVSRNVDLQGMVLILAGGFSWLAVLLGKSPFDWHGWAGKLLLMYIASCLVATCLTPHLGYNLLGTPYLRLGSLGLLSCIGFGLLLCSFKPATISTYLYRYSLVIVLVSVAYSWLRFYGLGRFGGVFSQADIMACVLAIGILLGWQYCSLRNLSGKAVLAGQMLLALLLFATETRAVIGLVILLSLFWVFRAKRQWFPAAAIATAVLLIAVFGLSHGAHTNRLSDTGFAKDSLSYRLDLQQNALRAAIKRPVLGYGPGNVADALDCRQLHGGALQLTCRQHYFFNSSHNIYLDRVLMLGWVGGLAFAGLICLAGSWAYRTRSSNNLGLIVLLLALYYVTNVTNIELELVLWVVLLQLLQSSRQHPDS